MKTISVQIESRIRAELAELESHSQLRDLQSTCGIDLSSNDYLGVAVDPRMKQGVREALDTAPRLAASGSRLLSGHDEVWNSVEQEFADWVGAEAALYFTSGYAANLGLLSTILRSGDTVFSDSANHASLIDGMRLSKARRIVFPHRDLSRLEDELPHHSSASPSLNGASTAARFIVTESIFSMEGDRAPLRELQMLAERYNASLIVDEAHATGVCGPEGRGCVAEAGLTGKVFATVHTCGKALASAGAFVCGSRQLRSLLINCARSFIFNTALPPYFATQVSAGMRLAKSADSERAQLEHLGIALRSDLQQEGFDTLGSNSHIVPVLLGSNDVALAFASRLQARGYGIRAIRPPTVPPETARLRLSLTARLSQSLLANLVREMAEVREELSSTQVAHGTRSSE